MMRLLLHVWQLALLLAVGGGVTVAWTYYRSDELLRDEILKHLAKNFPNAKITLERANYDLQGRVRLFDLSLSLPEESQPALTISETAITVDRQVFTAEQRVVIQQIRVSQPRIRMVRRPDGTWNWSVLKLDRGEQALLPDLQIAHGAVEFVLADHETRTMVNLPLSEIHVTAVPSSQQSYTIAGSAANPMLGELKFTGEAPLEPGPWKLDAVVSRLKVEPLTIRLAAIAVPVLRTSLRTLQAHEDQLRHKISASTASVTPEAAAPSTPYDFGATFTASLRLHMEQQDLAIAPNGRVQIQFQDGQLSNPLLPFPLFDVRGLCTVEPGQIWFQDVTARTGASQFSLQAMLPRRGHWKLLAQVDAVPISEPLISRLPAALQRQVQALALTGVVSGQIQVEQTASGIPQVSAEATLSEGTVRHERFPYPVQDISANLTWHHNTIQIQGRGLGSVSPVELIGTLNNPGPEGDATFDIRARDVTLDDAMRQALPLPVAQVINALQFQGRGDVWVRLIRPEGLNQKYHCELLGNIRDGSMIYRDFPYPLQQLTGRIKWDRDLIEFEQLRGVRDGAVFTGNGRYLLSPAPGVLQLSVQSSRTAFDRALYAALPTHLQAVWTAVAPQGQFDATANVTWSPGSPVRVEVPQMRVTEGEVVLRDFPYPFRDFQGLFAYHPEQAKLSLQEFSARHDDTQVSGSGEVHHHPNGTYTLKLDKLHVDDLAPTATLRKALPSVLREAVESLNPTGTYSFHGPVTLHGDQSEQGLTAADWDLQVLLAGCSMNTGLRVNNVHGRVHFQGDWTPQNTRINAQLDIDALDVLGNHQLTRVRGPVKIDNGQLVAGSSIMASAARGTVVNRVPASSRITAEAFDGMVTLDAVVNFLKEVEYVAALELTGGSLEKYAMRHLRGYSNVRGLMNGWMDLRGKGLTMRGLSGDGQLQISPAALYELPIFLQIFQLPQFAPINRAAFDYANFFFRIENERFNFSTIDLVGNTISLRGRGVIRFDGALMLDFFSMQPRNQVRVPGLRELVGVVNMMSQGWIAIEVRGPIGAPVARVVPLPAVDDALQQFLGAFNPRVITPPPIPWRGAPRTTAAPEAAPR